MRSIVLSKSSLRSTLARMSTHAPLIAFVLFVLMAGSNAVAVRFSNLELPPFWGAASRFALAALLFWGVVLVQRIALPRGRALLGILLYGGVGIGLSYALIYWALVRVEAGMAGIFLGLVPLATVFLAAAHGLEELSARKVLGALVAVGGIAIIAGGGLGAGLTIPVILALVAVPLVMAEGTVIFKLFPPASPAATNAIALSVGTLVLAGLSLLVGEKWSLPAGAATWAAFGYLVVLGTMLVFYLWLFVLARWPATKTTYAFIFLPLVGVVMSVLLTGEVITPSFVLGAAVALLGVWLGALRPVPRASAAQPAPAPELAPCSDNVAATADC